MALNQVRNHFFWLLDRLKGGTIKEHYEEIDLCINNPHSEKAKSIKETNIRNLLQHAAETTPYYQNLDNANKISHFPIIKKTTIQDNFDLFQSSTYKDKDNYTVSTSGSTGVPFFLFQDQRCRDRNHADVIFFLNQCGFKVGDKLYELEVWRGHNQKGKLKSWLQNVIQFDISKLTDERIAELIELLKSDKQSGKIILGFASAFEIISNYLSKHDIYLEDLGIDSVIANSEYLNPYTKSTFGKHLNTAVLSRYSSEEIGIIAHQTLESPNNFVVNSASYYVELLSFDNDQPVKPGEFGRIVVTDMFNYAMPIIRYDTGDIAKSSLHNGVLTFEQVEGRKMDLIYDTKGNMLSSFLVYTKFYKYYTLLQQYQFIQQGEKDYEVKLNLQEGTSEFEFEKELIDSVKSDFGEDARVIITYVDEIPALASGKRKKVVNNYTDS